LKIVSGCAKMSAKSDGWVVMMFDDEKQALEKKKLI
jgi:hypothetical protein